MTRLSEIRWVKKTKIIDEWLKNGETLKEIPLDAGLEAEVIRICSEETSVVLKVWNKDTRPDIEYQYRVLQALIDRGISVSVPLGWGFDPQLHKVLLTSFDGKLVDLVNHADLDKFAKLLADVHSFPANEFAFRQYDFIPWFFPDVEKHADIHDELKRLFKITDYRRDHLIHGDFHMMNVLEDGGKYTLIDWTNAQMGDARYDVAWTGYLVRVYLSERAYVDFLNAYWEHRHSKTDDIEVFESIACLRWLHLYRIGGLPMFEDTVSRVNQVLRKDRHLAGKFMIAE